MSDESALSAAARSVALIAVFTSFSVLASVVAAIVSSDCQTEPDRAGRCEAATKDECLEDKPCAWRTTREGPTCFWVDDVKFVQYPTLCERGSIARRLGRRP